MTEIEIRYRPISFLPWTRKILTRHPNAWPELTPAQFIAVACVYRGTMTDDRLISSMLGIPRRIVRKMAAYHKLKIIEMIEFIKDPAPHYEFIIRSVASFPCPKPRLKNETFGTFIFAEHYFSRYNDKSDPQDLDRFIACWYRPGKFSESEVEQVAKKICKEDLAVREAVFINYQLIREYLVVTYPNVFKTEAQTKKSDDRNTWLDVFDAVVGEDIKDQDKYANLPVSTVLRTLDKRIKKQLEDES